MRKIDRKLGNEYIILLKYVCVHIMDGESQSTSEYDYDFITYILERNYIVCMYLSQMRTLLDVIIPECDLDCKDNN